MALLTQAQKQHFIDEGYVILPNFVQSSYVQQALDYLENRLKNGKHAVKQARKGATEPGVKFGGHAKRAPQITDLVFKTGLLQVAEELLGEGNCTVRDNLGQIAYNPPLDDWIEQGKDINQPHPPRKWHVDSGHGKYASLGSDFSVLCGVALSDGQQVDENRGQFTLFPKSHYITHQALLEEIRRNPGGNATNNLDKMNMQIGKPMRALLSPGDAVVCHQRLAHAPGHNLWTETRINIYFRMVHKHIDDLLDEQVLSPTPWVGFEGLRDMLPEGAVEWEKGNGKKKGNPIKRLLAANGCHDYDVELQLTRAQKKAFIKKGYVVLENAIPKEMVEKTLAFVDGAYEKKQYGKNGQDRDGSEDATPNFKKLIKRGSEVTDLFFKTGLLDACEQLLGDGKAVLKDNMADVSFWGEDEIYVKEGMGMDELPEKKKWSLQHGGGEAKKHGGGEFNIVVAVQLSEGQDVDENRGLFTVWPGSHFETHKAMAEAAEEYDPTGDEPILKLFRSKKLKMGQPQRVPMKPGDVLIAHQRLGHTHGANLTQDVAKVIYFPIIHAEFDDRVEEYVSKETPFGLFEGIEELAEEIMNE